MRHQRRPLIFWRNYVYDVFTVVCWRTLVAASWLSCYKTDRYIQEDNLLLPFLLHLTYTYPFFRLCTKMFLGALTELSSNFLVMLCTRISYCFVLAVTVVWCLWWCCLHLKKPSVVYMNPYHHFCIIHASNVLSRVLLVTLCFFHAVVYAFAMLLFDNISKLLRLTIFV